MARKERKYHYIYKITCLKNNRYYIGMHSTDNLEDGYFGGGKRIKNSVKKHGKDAHRKEILEFFENRELLIEREKELVDDVLLGDPLCINLCRGGHYHDRGWTSDDRRKAKEKLCELNGDLLWKKSFSEKISSGLERAKKHGYSHLTFLGRSHSNQTKEKMSETRSKSEKYSGSSNSQFGKIWIHNDLDRRNKKVFPEDPHLLDPNWKKGLKMEYFKNEKI